jgi:hypothetical protein
VKVTESVPSIGIKGFRFQVSGKKVNIYFNFINILISFTKIYLSIMKKLPINCPSCEQALMVSQLSCAHCETSISGSYSLPILLQLSSEEQDFVFEFVRFSGSLKKMAEKMGKSYPTVRNRLDDILEKINSLNPSKS